MLEKLFGSHARVKLLKLFYLNSDSIFPPKDVARRAHITATVMRRELRVLEAAGFIKKATGFIEIPNKKDKKKIQKKRISGYKIDTSFQLFDELRELVLTVAPLSKKDLTQKLRRVGKVKLVVLAGIFLKESGARVDMLIVGDGLKKGQLDWTLRMIESEVGKELDYVILDTADFKYRTGMNDKFMRDVFDYPHEIIIDKIGFVK